MTQREQQILQWIQEDPMITQQELADRAGITRSSMAVHISNLTRKGLIAGRGYILSGQRYVAVAGGVNMDIGGRSAGPLVAADSNPGTIRMSLGGVGRNIAHNLALLDVDTRLVTALGDDVHAQKIAASCRELGIDLSPSVHVPGASTSTYLFIANEKGEMVLALSDMDIYRHLTPDCLAPQLPMLQSAQAVVLDANLPEETIAWLCRCLKVPVFADPVSTAKAAKLKPVLGRIHTLKPNLLEAELLTGIPVTDERSLHAAADALLEAGVKRLFLSLGSRGVLACEGTERILLPCPRGHAVSTTGCGDAFTAALVWAFLQGMDLRDSARAGLAAASVALEGSETINPLMSTDLIRERMSKQEV